MAKGKNSFTIQEADEIRELIREKLAAPGDKQVSIRNKIRAIGFYYTDFYENNKEGGYAVADFDDLIKTGHIKIR